MHDEASRLDRPVQELKAFEKVSLSACAEQQVTLKLDKRSFSYFDEGKNDWVLEPGRFTLRIGSSSRDIRIEVPLIITSSTLAFSLETPWIEVQTYEKAAAIVTNIIMMRRQTRGFRAPPRWVRSWMPLCSSNPSR